MREVGWQGASSCDREEEERNKGSYPHGDYGDLKALE